MSPTYSALWLINGPQSGEFTIWNGQSFNFEMILQGMRVGFIALNNMGGFPNGMGNIQGASGALGM